MPTNTGKWLDGDDEIKDLDCNKERKQKIGKADTDNKRKTLMYTDVADVCGKSVYNKASQRTRHG